MKKLLSIKLILFILSFNSVTAQCLIENPPEDNDGSRAFVNSSNGWAIPASGTFRILIVFAEIEYDTGTDPNPNSTSGWPIHSLPVWADQLLDPNVPTGTASGLLTRYFQEASFGQYNVIGDYLLSPTNGGIFTVKKSAFPNINSQKS